MSGVAMKLDKGFRGNVKVDIRTKKQKLEDASRLANSIIAVQMATLYTLRNQGWGEVRLKRFSEQWSETLRDISNGLYTFSDIADTIYDETGLRVKDFDFE